MPRIDLSRDWRFRAVGNPWDSNSDGAPQGAFEPATPDADWERVDLPHDATIRSPISQGAPIPGAPTNSGRNGWFPGSLVWYRKHLEVEASPSRRYFVEFDGAYRQCALWLNGHFVGRHPNGYFPFLFDLTPFMARGGNVLAARLSTLDAPSGRWYSGTGLTRLAYLWDLDETHFAPHGLSVTSPRAAAESAVVDLRAEIQGPPGRGRLQGVLFDPSGVEVARAAKEVDIPSTASLAFAVSRPDLWEPDAPARYRLAAALQRDGRVVDERTLLTGLRRIEFIPRHGFLLNGKPTKMKGVCLHHDGGPVGAAVPDSLWEFRLGELKRIGCNAIRTSHNPPSDAFLDLCDRLGFLVMDEFCDKWEPPHYLEFEERWEKDLEAWIRRDRNHPSVVVYSVGNENDHPGSPYLDSLLPKLCGKVRELDPTRPVLAGLERGGDAAGQASRVMASAASLDLVGINYGEQWYGEILERSPEALVMGTENYVYYTSLPGKREAFVEKNAWQYVMEDDRVLGSFYWAGIDYLGEAYRAWPRIGSVSGLFDITLRPKPMASLAACHWLAEPHLFLGIRESPEPPASMWSPPPIATVWRGTPGKELLVEAYSNGEEVSLFLNGRALGSRRAQPNRCFRWTVAYEPGELTARAKFGGKDLSESLRTPGSPTSLRLRACGPALRIGDVFQVEALLEDAAGTLCDDAREEAQFAVEGGHALVAVANGNLEWHGPFHGDRVPLHRGRAVVLIRAPSTTAHGTLRVACGAWSASLKLPPPLP